MFLHMFYGRQNYRGTEVAGKRNTATDLSNFAKDSAPIVCRCSSTVAIDVLRPTTHLGYRQHAKTTHGRRGHPESWAAGVILAQPIRQSRCECKRRGLTFGEGFFIVRQLVQGIQQAEKCLLPFRGASFARVVSWCNARVVSWCGCSRPY